MGVTLVILALLVSAGVYCKDHTQESLVAYKNATQGKTQILTTSAGIPVSSEYVQTINTQLLYNDYFLDFMTHFMRQRIPERIVHAKGAGAKGYFIVTDDLSDICKAKVFNTVGKVTPVIARFSPAFLSKGGSDLARQARGFAVKFYTEDGNFDYMSFNTEMFAIKDPIFFPDFNGIFQKSPITNLDDNNAAWDFLTIRPETLNLQTRVFSYYGIPDGYRHMAGFAIHTFELLNSVGKRTYVRFHLLPDAGIRGLTTEEAERIQAKDPDYASKDLYNAIADGNFPSWTLSVQTIPEHEISKANFDIFDVTRLWPVKEYPLRRIGQMVLNKNPENYFAEVEQLAFCPGNLVPGIRGVDTVFQARVLFYRDAQNYRLGVNHNSIPVNCPFANKAHTYNRNGFSPVWANGGRSPYYYPNSFNGPMPFDGDDPPRIFVYTNPNATNFDQTSEFYDQLDEDNKRMLVDNIVSGLSQAEEFIQRRAVKVYSQIKPDLGSRIRRRLVSLSVVSHHYNKH